MHDCRPLQIISSSKLTKELLSALFKRRSDVESAGQQGVSMNHNETEFVGSFFQEFARNSMSGKPGTNFGDRDSWSLTPYNLFTYSPALFLPAGVLRVWESKPAESSADAGASREPRGRFILAQEVHIENGGDLEGLPCWDLTYNVKLKLSKHPPKWCFYVLKRSIVLKFGLGFQWSIGWRQRHVWPKLRKSQNERWFQKFSNWKHFFRGLLNAAHISGCIWKVLPLTAHRHRCPFLFGKEFQLWRDFPGCNKQWTWFMKRFKVGWM